MGKFHHQVENLGCIPTFYLQITFEFILIERFEIPGKYFF